MAFNLGNKAAYRDVHVYDTKAGKSVRVTDGLADAVDPVFDASGKYLYLLGSTDAGPVNHWFAQSNADMRARRSVYLVVLKKGTPSPLAKEHDEEKAEKADRAAKDGQDKKDEGGGQVADYYIDILRRPFTANWATRYGESFKTPGGAIFGPKVMIIHEGAGSGGDLLPWMFRQYKMGPLVGKRTWGGLVGILGFPTLMDGGGVTAPNLAFWTKEEGFGVENVGCRRISTWRCGRRT